MADQINSLEDLKDVVADSGSATEIDLGPLLGKGMDDPPVVLQAVRRNPEMYARYLIGRGGPVPKRRACSRDG